jgi:hypothetical protein
MASSRGPKCRYHSQLRRNNTTWTSHGGCRKDMANILVVDDEHGIRDLLSEILNDEGHNVELAENAAQARNARQRGPARPGAAGHLDARHRRRHAAQGVVHHRPAHACP